MIGNENDLGLDVQQLVARLSGELGGRLPAETIAQSVEIALAELSGARIKNYVPVFAYRLARERLLGQLAEPHEPPEPAPARAL